MRRLVGPARLGLGLLLIAILGSLVAAPGVKTASVAAEIRLQSRPNIVLISTDDQTITDMRWMTKTNELLAANGVTFEGVSPHPLCCPARAEILTGQYAHNNGVYFNKGRTGGYQALKDPNNTIAAWLQAAGYRTGFSGKFLNGYSWSANGRPDGWDYWDPTIEGTYSYFDYTTANDGAPRKAPPGEYITDHVAQMTIDHIASWSAQSTPFFFWSSYVAPHARCNESQENCQSPPTPARQYAEAFPGAVNPAMAKPSFNEKNVSDKPKKLRVRKQDPERMQRLFHQRIRALASVDDAVASTVSALADAGQLDNTIIIFTSDNGFLLGEHRLRGKKRAFEESLRVPLIIRGPGFRAGRTNPNTGSILDIAPTILAEANAAAGRLLDGESLTELQLAGAEAGGETRLIQSGARVRRAHDHRWDWRGIRDHRYTWLRWSSGFIELYDRAVDPYELNNVASNPRYRQVSRVLRTRFHALGKCAGTAECYRDFGPVPNPLPHR